MNRNVLLQNFEKSDYMNSEIYSRNIPSTPLSMNFFQNHLIIEMFYFQLQLVIQIQMLK